MARGIVITTPFEISETGGFGVGTNRFEPSSLKYTRSTGTRSIGRRTGASTSPDQRQKQNFSGRLAY